MLCERSCAGKMVYVTSDPALPKEMGILFGRDLSASSCTSVCLVRMRQLQHSDAKAAQLATCVQEDGCTLSQNDGSTLMGRGYNYNWVKKKKSGKLNAV